MMLINQLMLLKRVILRRGSFQKCIIIKATFRDSYFALLAQ